jgi:hypothetical protein
MFWKIKIITTQREIEFVTLGNGYGLSQIVDEKLDKSNFQVWKFKMMNFLMGKEYFEFIINEEQEPTFTKIHSSQHQ